MIEQSHQNEEWMRSAPSRRPRSRRAMALITVLFTVLSVLAIGTGTASADTARFNGCRAWSGGYASSCTITVTSYTSGFRSNSYSCTIRSSSPVSTCEIRYFVDGKWQTTRVFR